MTQNTEENTTKEMSEQTKILIGVSIMFFAVVVAGSLLLAVNLWIRTIK